MDIGLRFCHLITDDSCLKLCETDLKWVSATINSLTNRENSIFENKRGLSVAFLVCDVTFNIHCLTMKKKLSFIIKDICCCPVENIILYD